MQYFNIQVASQLSGVASATIRAWEKRYKAVIPERADNKHRLYSEQDIEKLSLLYRLTEVGQSIGKIAHLNLGDLKKVYSTLMQRPYEEPQRVSFRDEVDFEKIRTSLQLALVAYKLDIISHELEKAKNSLTPRDLCLNVIVPLFHEIGRKVANNELSIAQEHTLSAISSFHIGQMIGLHYQNKNLKEGLVLITTPEGELHEIGILASALLCVHHRIPFIFLGTNLPAASLAEAANALKPRAMLMGLTSGYENFDQSIEGFISELTNSLKVQSEIWLGGNLKSAVRTKLEKRGIPFFSSLESLDDFLSAL